MRHLRLGLVLATAALLAAGCTDPSPEVEQPTSAQSTEESTGTATEDASSEADETPSATGAPEPPVFGTLVGMPGAPASACVAEALGAPLTFSTVLTAADAIVLDALALETTPADAEPEVLDAWVLPFEGGPAGVGVGEFPPADPHAARQDAAGYELAAGASVTVGVGVTATEPTTMTLVLTYHGGDDVERTLTSQHELAVAETCSQG